MEPQKTFRTDSKTGYYISLFTAILTIITFTIAFLTPPLSGPFCVADCYQYPFTDIASRFPRDYYWMFLAIFLEISYLIMMLTVHHTTKPEKKLYSLIGTTFAIMSALILMVDYFLQLSIIQPSLLAGEMDGISILTQFNPHGVFIVLEEMGFLFMIISFFALFPVFSEKKKWNKAIQWTGIIGFILAIIAFILISLKHGIHKEYRFEVAIITIAWCELIIMSFLFAKYFKKLK